MRLDMVALAADRHHIVVGGDSVPADKALDLVDTVVLDKGAELGYVSGNFVADSLLGAGLEDKEDTRRRYQGDKVRYQAGLSGKAD